MVEKRSERCRISLCQCWWWLFRKTWRQRNNVHQRETFPERKWNRWRTYSQALGMKAGAFIPMRVIVRVVPCGTNDTAGIGAGIYRHEPQDAQLYFGDWGFDFIKIDYCGGDALGLNEKERYTQSGTVWDKVNKDASINICRWAFPGTWAKDAATSWRISGDINAHWGSLRYVVGKNLYLSAYAGNGHYNDMDMMVIGFRNDSKVGGKVLPDRRRSSFRFMVYHESPLLIGCNLKTYRDLLPELLEKQGIDCPQPRPAGFASIHVAQHENEGWRYLVKDIEQNVEMYVLWLSTIPIPLCSFSVPFSSFEFWKRESTWSQEKMTGKISPTFERTLPAHGAMFLRMEGETRLEADSIRSRMGILTSIQWFG